MNKDFLISIIVPVYNVSSCVSRCIESIIAQSYREIEVIIVDDGSTDESGNICDNFSFMDSRIIVHHIKNQGVSFARNFGISLAKGDYIGFVDADDTIETDMYEKLLNETDGGTIDIVQCNYWSIQFDGQKQLEQIYKSETLAGDFKEKFLFIPNKKISNSVWSKIFSRKVLSSIKFDDTLKIGEDFKFVFQACMVANKIKIIPEPYYNYLMRQDSVINSSSFVKRLDDFVINDWCLNQHTDDDDFQKLVRTRDVKCCLDIYYYATILSVDKSQKRMIVDRIKKDKKRYRIGIYNEILLFIISHFPFIFDTILRKKNTK